MVSPPLRPLPPSVRPIVSCLNTNAHHVGSRLVCARCSGSVSTAGYIDTFLAPAFQSGFLDSMSSSGQAVHSLTALACSSSSHGSYNRSDVKSTLRGSSDNVQSELLCERTRTGGNLGTGNWRTVKSTSSLEAANLAYIGMVVTWYDQTDWMNPKHHKQALNKSAAKVCQCETSFF